MQEPTKRQLDVLRFVAKRITKDGWAPTHREIGDALHISSTNGVAEHLHELQRKGFIERADGQARAMRLTPQGLEVARVRQ